MDRSLDQEYNNSHLAKISSLFPPLAQNLLLRVQSRPSRILKTKLRTSNIIYISQCFVVMEMSRLTKGLGLETILFAYCSGDCIQWVQLKRHCSTETANDFTSGFCTQALLD